MTKAEIIAELRRSATEDKCPFGQAEYIAWQEVVRLMSRAECSGWVEDYDIRLLFLIVACALEDE